MGQEKDERASCRTRTYKPLIKRPSIQDFKSLDHKKVTPSVMPERTTGRTKKGEGNPFDADLAKWIEAWPTLPGPVQAAIRALADFPVGGI